MHQTSRAALIELLFLALYIDDRLSLAEDAALEKALNALGWESPQPKEIFILNAFARAREASSCEEKTNIFLSQRANVIVADEESSAAFDWLGKVLAADGVSMSEARFLEKVQKALFLE